MLAVPRYSVRCAMAMLAVTAGPTFRDECSSSERGFARHVLGETALDVVRDLLSPRLWEMYELHAKELALHLGAMDHPTLRQEWLTLRKGDHEIYWALELAPLEAVGHEDASAARADVARLEDVEEALAHQLDLNGFARSRLDALGSRHVRHRCPTFWVGIGDELSNLDPQGESNDQGLAPRADCQAPHCRP